MRLVAVIFAVALGGLLAPAALAQVPATPPCPQVQGWTPAGTFGPIDNGNAVEFQCIYDYPGYVDQLTLDVNWYKPTARDVDVDYTECGRAASGGAYYTDIYGGTNIVHEEYGVSGGATYAEISAIFQAELQHIQAAAQVFMQATETLAKSCTPSSTSNGSSSSGSSSGGSAPPTNTGSTGSSPATAPSDTTPPTVHLRRASGRAGSRIAFHFLVADDSGQVDVLLTIYRGSGRSTVLMSKDYGTVAADQPGRSYVATIQAHGRGTRGTHRWCITAANAAGNSTTACSSLVVH
jgi:hypothetical protein